MSPVLPNVSFRGRSPPAPAGIVPPMLDKYEGENNKESQVSLHS